MNLSYEGKPYQLGDKSVLVVHGQWLRYNHSLGKDVCLACHGGLFDDQLGFVKKDGLRDSPLDPNCPMYDYEMDKRLEKIRYGACAPMSVYQCTCCGMMTGPWVPWDGHD